MFREYFEIKIRCRVFDEQPRDPVQRAALRAERRQLGLIGSDSETTSDESDDGGKE